jgi:SAM-dependent methyltransferase
MTQPAADDIREYWNDQAKRYGTNLIATMPDPLLKKLELATLRRWLDPIANTLEFGCGNGFNLIELSQFLTGTLIGVDYACEMISAANHAVAARPDLAHRCSFMVGDILAVPRDGRRYPQIFTDRCLINLPSLQLQLQGVVNLTEMLESGGRLALIECAQQPLARLNELRKAVGLGSIKTHWHNLYLDEQAFLAGIPKALRLIAIEPFASLYYIASRVFNAKLTPEGEAPDYLAPINHIASLLPPVGDCGPHKIYVFEKE